MTNLEVHGTVPTDLEGDPEADLASLRGDCAVMAPHWTVPDRIAVLPVSPSLIHGVSVPSRSARMLDAMPEYGN